MCSPDSCSVFLCSGLGQVIMWTFFIAIFCFNKCSQRRFFSGVWNSDVSSFFIHHCIIVFLKAIIHQLKHNSLKHKPQDKHQYFEIFVSLVNEDINSVYLYKQHFRTDCACCLQVEFLSLFWQKPGLYTNLITFFTSGIILSYHWNINYSNLKTEIAKRSRI